MPSKLCPASRLRKRQHRSADQHGGDRHARKKAQRRRPPIPVVAQPRREEQHGIKNGGSTGDEQQTGGERTRIRERGKSQQRHGRGRDVRNESDPADHLARAADPHHVGAAAIERGDPHATSGPARRRPSATSAITPSRWNVTVASWLATSGRQVVLRAGAEILPGRVVVIERLGIQEELERQMREIQHRTVARPRAVSEQRIAVRHAATLAQPLRPQIRIKTRIVRRGDHADEDVEAEQDHR